MGYYSTDIRSTIILYRPLLRDRSNSLLDGYCDEVGLQTPIAEDAPTGKCRTDNPRFIFGCSVVILVAMLGLSSIMISNNILTGSHLRQLPTPLTQGDALSKSMLGAPFFLREVLSSKAFSNDSSLSSSPTSSSSQTQRQQKQQHFGANGGSQSKQHRDLLSDLWVLINNRVLIVGLTTCLLTQVVKAPMHSLLSWIYLRRVSWECWRVGEAGGMPSSHTSCCSAVVMTIGLHHGFDSYLFGLAAIITLVIAHDAMGVRWAASRHARFINAVVRMENAGLRRATSTNTMRMFENLRQSPLKEKLGHRSQEVVAGFFFGLACAALVECLDENYQDLTIRMVLLVCLLLIVCGKYLSLCSCCSPSSSSRVTIGDGSSSSQLLACKKGRKYMKKARKNNNGPSSSSSSLWLRRNDENDNNFGDSYQDFRVLRGGYPASTDIPIIDPKALAVHKRGAGATSYNGELKMPLCGDIAEG
mmetsp:Transcript_25390/g.40722  ORF Transcript_25390/g.40722 Transcript_25390/m.40722 type:complete len:473 (-) Transcript_25390:254-1672(-)